MAQEGEADEGCAAVGEFGPVVLRLFDPSPDTVLSDSGGGEGRLVDGGGLSGCRRCGQRRILLPPPSSVAEHISSRPTAGRR